MILDKAFIEEKVIELTREMKCKEVFLRFAKEQEVRESLNSDIAKLALQRDIYLSFYEFEELTMEIDEKEENEEGIE